MLIFKHLAAENLDYPLPSHALIVFFRVTIILFLCIMKIEQDIPSFVWLTEIPDVEIASSVVTNVTFTNSSTGEVIYNENLYPNASGRITVYDVAHILRQSMIDAVEAGAVLRRFKMQVTTTTESATTSFGCFYATTPIDINPVTFANGSFFTRNIDRETTIDAHESLSFCHISLRASVRCTATCYFEGLRPKTVQIMSATYSVTHRYKTIRIDVSPATIVEKSGREGYRLLAYDINLTLNNSDYGALAHYTVNYAPRQRTATFYYRNPFGVYEYLNVFGNDTTKRTFEKSMANVNRIETVYKTKLKTNHEISTSIESQQQRDVMEDFFASEDVWLVEGNEIVAQVVIDDITHETSDAYDALDSYKFTWRLADSNHRSAVSMRIFDDTFDGTFE